MFLKYLGSDKILGWVLDNERGLSCLNSGRQDNESPAQERWGLGKNTMKHHVFSGVEIMDTLRAENRKASCIPNSGRFFSPTKFLSLQDC